MTRTSLVVRALAGFLGAVLVLTSCGGDDGGGGSSEETEDTEAPEETLTSQGEELDELFQDDLEDDENGWGEGEGEVVSTEFTDDGYEVGITDEDQPFWGYADAGPLVVEDSSTTVEVAEGTGEADRWFGTVCRLARTGPVAFYTLLVNGESGEFSIARWSSDDDDPEVLEEGEDEAIEGLAAEDEAEVTGTCLGEGDGDEVELAVAVDGTEVGTATDEEGLAAGISGLAVAALDGDDGDEPVTFSDITVLGDEGDGDVEWEDDFSDPDESGIEPFEEEGNAVDFGDGNLVFDVTGSAFAPLPIRSPIPEEGSASVDVEGDLVNGFAGICLGGEGGDYEFAISSDGYASLGFYPADGGEFVLLDEATEAYEFTGDHRVTGNWTADGSATSLEISVDGEVMTSVGNDSNLGSFTQVSLCGAVGTQPNGPSDFSVTFDDVEVAAEG